MRKRKQIVIVGASALALAAGGAGIAGATSGSDPETPITGGALQRASAAALHATGGGKVTGTEVGDEESYYQVEVTKADGTQTDVQLDRDLTVVDRSSDQEAAGDTSANPPDRN